MCPISFPWLATARPNGIGGGDSGYPARREHQAEAVVARVLELDGEAHRPRLLQHPLQRNRGVDDDRQELRSSRMRSADSPWIRSAVATRKDEGFGDVSDPELRHGLTISHITRENIGRQAVEDGRSGE